MKDESPFLPSEIEMLEKLLNEHRVSSASLMEWIEIIALLADNGVTPENFKKFLIEHFYDD